MHKQKIRTGIVVLTGAMALGLLGGLGGCASSVPRRVEAVRVPMGGASWDLVMASPAVQDEQLAGGWEQDRNNDRLAIASNNASLASDEWPEDARPSLDNARRLYLPQNPNTILYYSNDRGQWRRSGGGGGGSMWYGQ